MAIEAISRRESKAITSLSHQERPTISRAVQPSLRDSFTTTVTMMPAMSRRAIVNRPPRGSGGLPLVGNGTPHKRRLDPWSAPTACNSAKRAPKPHAAPARASLYTGPWGRQRAVDHPPIGNGRSAWRDAAIQRKTASPVCLVLVCLPRARQVVATAGGRPTATEFSARRADP